MHTQKGYSAQNLGTTFIAKLYDTEVLKIDQVGKQKRVSFKSGGFHTISTAKAINGALKDQGLDTVYSVKVIKGQLTGTIKSTNDSFIIN